MGLSATMYGLDWLDYSLHKIMSVRKTEISTYRPSRNGSFTFQRRRYGKPSSAEWDSDHNFCIAACIQPSNEGPLNLTLLHAQWLRPRYLQVTSSGRPVQFPSQNVIFNVGRNLRISFFCADVYITNRRPQSIVFFQAFFSLAFGSAAPRRQR